MEDMTDTASGIPSIDKKLESIQNTMLDKEEIKKLASDLSDNSEETEVISNLFYASAKSLFDLGFELVKNLNLEYILEKFSKEKDKE